MLNEYLEAFLEETNDNINIISENILNLELDPQCDEYMENIFRAAHTIKGASAIMELWDIQKVTHNLEDLFDDLRNHRAHVDKQVITVVLNTVTCIEGLKDKISQPDIEVDVDGIIKKIRDLRNSARIQLPEIEMPEAEEKESVEIAPKVSETADSGSITNFPIKLTEAMKDTLSQAGMDGYNAYKLSVEFEPDCKHRYVRLYMVHENLQECGELISMKPSIDEFENAAIAEEQRTLEDMEEDSEGSSIITGGGNNTVYALFLTKEKADFIEKRIMAVSEIKSAQVSEIGFNEILAVSEVIKPSDSVQEDVRHQEEQEAEKKKEEPSQASSQSSQPQANSKVSAHQTQTIRVNISDLEELMNDEGELLIENNRLEILLQLLKKGDINLAQVSSAIEDIHGNIEKNLQHQQDVIMRARMSPLENVFAKFPRMVRELADRLGKEVDFSIEGQETGLDKSIHDKIFDPMVHLVRNALDHGIELPEVREAAGKPRVGTVKIIAKQENEMVTITIQDDGAGIDLERIKAKALRDGLYTEAQLNQMSYEDIINIVFSSGFSTVNKVTDISGRGVGMDIVKSRIEQIGGLMNIKTQKGIGTTFMVKIPLTLAISDALLVKVEDETFAFILSNIDKLSRVGRDSINEVKGKKVLVHSDGNVYPLVYLRDIYSGFEHKERDLENIVLVGNTEKKVALVVDSFIGEMDIVVKGLNKYLGNPEYVAGLTKLGDGSIPVIVDVADIIDKLRSL